jgi:hypothetical protein
VIKLWLNLLKQEAKHYGLKSINLLKNYVWDVMLCGSYKNQLLEECIASTIRLEGITELVTTSAITSNKHQVLQEPHVVTSQKVVFFIVTAMKISNLL